MEKYGAVMPIILQRFAWAPLRTLMVIFGSLEIKGVENIERIKGNMIIASNHISELDPLLLVACLPFLSRHLPFFYVSLEKSFYKKGWRTLVYGGRFFKMMGAYPAYVGLNNYEKALQHHLKIIEQGGNVCIFPMGRIRLQNEHAKAKGGVGYLAKTTGLPILPVRIQGLDNITFKEFFGRKRKVIVTFGEPLYAKDIFKNVNNATANDKRNDYEKAAEVLMEKIVQLA